MMWLQQNGRLRGGEAVGCQSTSGESKCTVRIAIPSGGGLCELNLIMREGGCYRKGDRGGGRVEC